MSEKLTHWKKLHNPNYLGAFSFDPGKDMILTVKYTAEETVVGADGSKEDCMVIHFVEPALPFICNVTNAKTIADVLKTPYVERWSGRKIQFYVTKVKAFGETVDAVRVRPYPPKVENPICSECGKPVEGFGKMTAQQVAQYSEQKYGRIVCTVCGKKLSEMQAEPKLDEQGDSEHETE